MKEKFIEAAQRYLKVGKNTSVGMVNLVKIFPEDNIAIVMFDGDPIKNHYEYIPKEDKFIHITDDRVIDYTLEE